MKKKWLAAALMTLLAVGVAGCGNKQNSEKAELHVGYFNNVTHAQALLMKADGSLEDSLGEDVDVSWTAFNAGPAEVEALFAGDIDIGYIGPVPAVSANVKSKGDVQVLASATQAGAALVARKESGIQSVKDLSGKTVAIPQIGNTQHLCLLNLLTENGLKPVTDGGDVTVSAVANADVANMMDRGDVDAALVPEPWASTLLKQGAELVLDYDQVFMDGKYDVAVVVVRKEYMEEHPDIVEAFLKEHEAATTRIVEDTDSSLTTLNEELLSATGKSLGEDIIKEAFSRIQVSTVINEEALMKFADISKEQGFINEVPEKESLFVKK